jgi:hypothetical protein
MKRLPLFCRALLPSLALVPLLWLPAAAQKSGKPITEKGLEDSLKAGGLKDSELIPIIQKRGVDFILSSDLQQRLAAAGASPALLEAVRTHYHGPDGDIVTPPPVATSHASERAAERAPNHASLPTAPGIYVQRGAAWVPLHQESAEYVPEGMVKAFGKASGGLLKLRGDVNAEIAGSHSNIAVNSPAVFLIRMPPGLTAGDYLLVHTHEKHDNREFKVSADTLKSKDNVAYRLLDLSGSNLEIEVSQGAGDYAFVDATNQPSHAPEDHKIFLYTFQIAP